MIIVMSSSFLFACEQKKDPREKYTYHVWLQGPEPDKKVIYSGTVTGLSSCRYIAKNRIRSPKSNPGWTYFCCHDDGSDKCAERDE